MYALNIKQKADKIFSKLAKKNPKQLRFIQKKLQEIQTNPEHEHKFLHSPLQNFNRIHIDKHFVLIFKIDHNQETVDVYYYDHHDNVYLWRPNP
ncbi:type II toxin-antitoxin system RelE/ParE family toxin [Candidatus Woesearchaeota archaeon]|nr:type II toxin-antitoxin system RelE/ParE family toxin [Candidatus Woesearchaeota archaeon]